MVFSSLLFVLAFLPANLICYFTAKSIRTRNIILLLFSLVFYAWGEPAYIFLLLASVAVNYFCGLGIDKYRDTPKAKACIAAALIYNIGALIFFKYTGFFISNINSLLGVSIHIPSIRMPLGISFYTFQITSYIIDCYWENVDVQKSYSKLLLYVSLFPQLVAGPIVRYSTIEEEITNRKSTFEDVSAGMTRFIVGLAKKVIIANNLHSLVVEPLIGIEDISKASFVSTVVGVICYAIYVYYDFSGYSDMAIGLGRIFGFHFDENFRYPFVSANITEFWQRWHISLGSFFRDYLLYVPIFGKRRKYLGLFLVWFCTGFWHGAAWNFIIWGLYFGAFILIELLLGKKRMKKIPKAISHIYSLIVIAIGFGIFYFEDLSSLGNFFKNLVFANGNAFISGTAKSVISENILLILVSAFLSMPVLDWFKNRAKENKTLETLFSYATILTNIVLLVISAMLLVDSTSNVFLYWRF